MTLDLFASMSLFVFQVCQSYGTNITSFFSAGPIIWFPVVIIAVTAVIAIVALIYMISPLIGRNDIRTWARGKLYDCAITVVFAIIFLSFSTLLICINPVDPLHSAGLLPDSCYPGSAVTPSPNNIGDIFGVAACDIYTYNQYLADFSNALFYLSIVGGISPVIQPPPITIGGVGISFQITPLPIVFVHQYVIPYLTLYYGAAIASFVLQILVSASMLVFTIFIVLGLIARSFGVTKSFGGTMIAFGLGIGVIFPIMVSLSYGFLDAVISNLGAGGLLGVPIANLFSYVFTGVLSAAPAVFTSGPGGAFEAAIQTVFTPLITYAGFIGAGLIIVPMLNLIVVDAFIVDFSRAIGERMDLFSILTRVL